MSAREPFYSGLEGSLWAIEEENWMRIAAVRNWSFTQNQNVLETTTMGDTDRTLIDGVRSLSGSCSLFYYNFETEEPNDDTGAGRILQKILKPLSIVEGAGFSGLDYRGGSTGDTKRRSTRMAFRLQVDKEIGSMDDNDYSDIEKRKYIWINAWITSFQMTVGVGEVLSCEVTFEADGTAIESYFSDYTNARTQ